MPKKEGKRFLGETSRGKSKTGSSEMERPILLGDALVSHLNANVGREILANPSRKKGGSPCCGEGVLKTAGEIVRLKTLSFLKRVGNNLIECPLALCNQQDKRTSSAQGGNEARSPPNRRTGPKKGVILDGGRTKWEKKKGENRTSILVSATG